MAEQGTATEKVADDELSQAWDEVTTEKKGVPVETKPVKEEKPKEAAAAETPPAEKPASEQTPPVDEAEKLDHQESSKLGRKVKGLESRLDQILARLEQPQTAKQEPVQMPDVISTPEDVETVLQAREQKAQQARKEYEVNYLKQVDSLKSANDELHDEIVAEMLQSFNVMHDPKNPFADARVNYAEAKSSVLTKRYTSKAPSVPARETAGKPPVQPAASATRTAPKTVAMPKLDPEAQAYVSYLRSKGMSDEQIAQELA